MIVHPTSAWLAAAHPFLPAARWAAAPAGRRYLAGWAMATELHVLNDTYMDRRAAGEDSQRALRGTARAALRPDRARVQQRAAAAPLGAAALRALPALGVADRGRRRSTSRPGAALPRRRDPPHARGRAAGVPALGPRRDHPRRAPSSTCSSARSGPDAVRHARLAPAKGRRARATCELAFDEPHARDRAAWRRHLREEVARAGTDATAPAQRLGPPSSVRAARADVSRSPGRAARRSAATSATADDQPTKSRSRRADARDPLGRAPRAPCSASTSSSRAGSYAGLGDEHVARAGGEEVRDVEAARAAQDARDPLLEQHPLDQLRLGLVAAAGDPDQLAVGVLGLDLARALVGVGDRLLLALPA